MLLWKLLLNLVGWWRPKEKPKHGGSAIPRKKRPPAHGHCVDELPMSSILSVLIFVDDGAADVELSCGLLVHLVSAKVLRIINDGKTAVVDFSWRRK